MLLPFVHSLCKGLLSLQVTAELCVQEPPSSFSLSAWGGIHRSLPGWQGGQGVLITAICQEQLEGLFIAAVQSLSTFNTPALSATQRSDKTKTFSFLLPYFWEYRRIQHSGYPPKLQDAKNPCSKLVRSNIWDLTIQIPGESLPLEPTWSKWILLHLSKKKSRLTWVRSVSVTEPW